MAETIDVITDEEYDVIDEFYDHIRKKVNKDVDDFMKATNEEDELQIILRGHLYIEHEIEKMLRNYLVEPKFVLGNKSMFMNKLNLSCALGLISENKRGAYKKLNDLRNYYAHELNYKMTEVDLKKVVDSMDDELKSDVFEKEWNTEEDMSDEKRNLLKLKRFMLSLWVYVSKLVYQLSIEKYHKQIDEVEAIYLAADNTKTIEECEAACIEILQNLRKDLGMRENS